MIFLKDFPNQSLFLLLVMEEIKPCSVGAFWHWEGGGCCCRTVAVVCSSGLFHAEHVELQSLWAGKVSSSKPSSASETCVT